MVVDLFDLGSGGGLLVGSGSRGFSRFWHAELHVCLAPEKRLPLVLAPAVYSVKVQLQEQILLLVRVDPVDCWGPPEPSESTRYALLHPHPLKYRWPLPAPACSREQDPWPLHP